MSTAAASTARRRRRFSLLTCLESGERYFGSHAATFYPDTTHEESLKLRMTQGNERLPGRLMISSKGLTFEPDDTDAPLMRIPLREVPRPIFEWAASSPRAGGFEVEASCVATRTEKFSPLQLTKLSSSTPLRFSLLHTRPAELVRLLNSLLEISMRPHAQQSQALQQLYDSSAEFTTTSGAFDQTVLVDPLEAQVLQVRVQRVRPMMNLPSLLLLTESRIYVSESAGIDNPLTHWPITALERVVRRTHLMRPTALEMQFRRGSGVDSGRGGVTDAAASARLTPDDPEVCLVVLGSHGGREQLVSALERAAFNACGAPLPPPPESRLREQTARWRHGLIDNFDYLTFLNDAAGRSLSDLTQYPVFPWVIKDFTSEALDLSSEATYRDLSKPIGALDAERLERFRERCASLEPSERFLYGTHYSAPAFVGFFLLRVAPEVMLHLHGGRFDEPDRQFASITESWHSALTSTTDVKELIPQFYHPAASAFLINGRGLELGVRQDGSPVGDVVLPPWAASPADFVSRCREALESEVVSARLHLWIDLIFGCKQRGESALHADNLFCPLCYHADYESAGSPEERRALEAQVQEFGQVPTQLFDEPHPHRLPGASKGPLTDEKKLAALLLREVERSPDGFASSIAGASYAAGRAAAESQTGGQHGASDDAATSTSLGAFGMKEALGKLRISRRVDGLYSAPVSSVCHAEDGVTLCSTGANQLRIYCPKRGRLLRASAAGELQLSSCLQLLGLDLLALGSWDHRLHIYSVGRGKVIETRASHDDAISCLDGSWSGGTAATSALADPSASPLLVSGSWDSTVRIWPLLPTGIAPTPLRTLGEHDAKVLCVALLPSDVRLSASGSAGGDVALWDARRPGSPALLLEPHVGRGMTTGVAMSSLSGSGTGDVCMVTCADDGSVAVAELRAPRLRMLRTGGAPQSCIRAFKGGALSAGEDGVVHMWDSQRHVMEMAADLATPEIDATLPHGADADLGEGGARGPGSARRNPHAIRSMHLWSGSGAGDVSLVTGHESGQLCWWKVPNGGDGEMVHPSVF